MKSIPKFSPKQRQYIGEVCCKVYKAVHDEHCTKGHGDCNHDKNDLIDVLMNLGLTDREIHASILGIELSINL